jgi:murein DD-endopeptidase MepM/ murein hydrolase activator NlpD
MVSIIENQRISKRRKTSHLRFNNKSAGFNSEFMSRFQQKPHSPKKRKKTASKPKLWFFDIGAKRNYYEKKRHHRSSAKTGSGFSLTFSPLATLAVIAGTIIVAFAALNWEDINIKTPSIYAFQPSVNTDTEQQTILYAATGIPGILPFNSFQEERATVFWNRNNDAQTTDTIDENPHGLLITFEWQPYRVQKGDTVSAIAQKFQVSVGAIIASNDIRNARRLQEGALLRIPNIDGIPYQIKKGDNLSRIAASFNVPLEVVLDVNDIKNDNIKAGETIFIPGARMNDIDLRLSLGDLFMYPLQTRFITSPFGMRRDPKTGVLQFHGGVDFRANTGTTVMASFDGVVSVVGENRLYGKYILLSHNNGYKTFYGHLNSFSVKEGDRVARGRKIGEVGNTGYSTGPHLHFGIYDRNNRLVNPLDLLK